MPLVPISKGFQKMLGSTIFADFFINPSSWYWNPLIWVVLAFGIFFVTVVFSVKSAEIRKCFHRSI
jgi:hypothetical protein